MDDGPWLIVYRRWPMVLFDSTQPATLAFGFLDQGIVPSRRQFVEGHVGCLQRALKAVRRAQDGADRRLGATPVLGLLEPSLVYIIAEGEGDFAILDRDQPATVAQERLNVALARIFPLQLGKDLRPE